MASTAASSATTATATSARTRNPRDSMTSTWRTTSRADWTLFHWLYQILDLFPDYIDRKAPVHAKTDKVPHLPSWMMHRWIIFHAAVPLILHQAYATYFGRNLGPIATTIYYAFVFHLIGIHQLRILRRCGYIYGYLDGDKHERDGIPDIRVRDILISLMSTVIFRMVLATVLSYDVTKTPLQMDWLYLPLEISLYGVVLDFWFYWYHRVMHQYDALWSVHRTHHLTKHPNALLALYADSTQEVFDIVGIPLMTWLTLKAVGLPMGFYEWWICHQYLVFPELTGHSGVRVHAETPSPVKPLLKLFNSELVIEDHDLHHRKGWRKSYNYGKQTRLWDRIFGTCTDRIETTKDNIDYDNPASLPLF